MMNSVILMKSNENENYQIGSYSTDCLTVVFSFIQSYTMQHTWLSLERVIGGFFINGLRDRAGYLWQDIHGQAIICG